MDVKHHYDMALNKKGLLIELSSDDVYFVTKQMDKWFRIFLKAQHLSAALPSSLPQMPEKEPGLFHHTGDLQTGLAPEIVASAEAPPVLPSEAPIEKPEPVLKASTEEPAPVMKSEPPSPAQDDFEAVMDSLMEDLGEPSPAALAVASARKARAADEAELFPERSAPENEPMPEFMQKAELPNFKPRPSLDTIDSLSDLCRRGYASTAEDFLLLSAYYLTFFDAVEKFSLKRINSLMVKTGLTPVNHSVLETAIEKGFLSIVPDLTGLADVTEYSLTEIGQKSAERLL